MLRHSRGASRRCRRPESRPTGPNLTYQAAEAIQRGRNDAVVIGVTTAIAGLNNPPPGLLYMRGFALNQLARFGDAERDLAPLGDFTPYAKWPPASELVKQIEEMRKLCPSKVLEVKDGDEVAFRVYYDDDDPWTKELISLLPKASWPVSTRTC